MKSNLALSAVEQRTLDGNAQSVDLITATGISQIDQSKKPNECNAEHNGGTPKPRQSATLAPSACCDLLYDT